MKPLTVGSVEATAENAKSGDYPLSRPFLFCYYEDKVTDAGKAFLQFALSEEGQAAVEEHGGIKVTGNDPERTFYMNQMNRNVKRDFFSKKLLRQSFWSVPWQEWFR